ncbi:hypothetical protein [Streptomyces griseoluteus]
MDQRPHGTGPVQDDPRPLEQRAALGPYLGYAQLAAEGEVAR